MTLTVIASDPEAGMLGLATMTCLVGVGDVVPAGRLNVGLIACQAHIRPSARTAILNLMEKGISMSDAVAEVLAKDPLAERRQILGIDASFKPFAVTGAEVESVCGALLGANYVIAGNLLRHQSVLHAAEMALLQGMDRPIHERLMSALLAGEQAGGDRRGRKSAAMYVLRPDQRQLSLRIDFAEDPLRCLREAMIQRVSPELDTAFNR